MMPDIASVADIVARILAGSHIALGLVSIFYPAKGTPCLTSKTNHHCS